MVQQKRSFIYHRERGREREREREREGENRVPKRDLEAPLNIHYFFILLLALHTFFQSYA